MQETIKEVLMRRDGMTEEDADDLIAEAKEDFARMLDEGEDPSDICANWFGLEMDYLEEFF